MSFVPNAYVDQAKVNYLLRTGKSKFFLQHGFDPSNPQELEAALLCHPMQNAYENIFFTVHGVKYTVRCSMPSPDTRNPCTFTVWIIDVGQNTPRFVTAYASP